MKNIVTVLILALFLFSCKTETKENYKKQSKITSETHPGKKIMEMQCYVCHNPETEHDSRIAPPMIAIKKHYIGENTTKEAFIAAMQQWIKTPSDSIAKMPGAIRKFGIMPFASYAEADIEQIADYMYDNEIEEPSWFQEHYEEEHGKKNGNGNGQGKRMRQGHAKVKFETKGKTYEEIGLHYALNTKKQLGKNLMGTIQKKGTVEALEFCNERAYPLTDSMATVFSANIKRVSDKPRNPKNVANSKELIYIEKFKNDVLSKVELKPIIDEVEDQVKFYYPITTNTMCLQCHGNPNAEIKPETYKTLNALYPNDKATGYDVDQVRGIWSISFEKTISNE